MMNKENPADYRVEDFLMDESFINYHFRKNSDDQFFWEEWLIRNPGKAHLVKEAREMIQILSLTLPDDEYQEGIMKMRRAIRPISPILTDKSSAFHLFNGNKVSRLSKSKRNSIIWLAAGVLILLIGRYFFLQSSRSVPNSFIQKHNAGNQPLILTLADSTVVTLAPQSSLRYPVRFGEGDRKVYLDGEAQFEVSRNSYKPFQVYTDNIIATVLGTVFNIRKQIGDSGLLVELLKGKLKVETVTASGSNSQSIILHPHERLRYIRHNQSLLKETWEKDKDSPVPLNHVVFRQSNFEEIARELKSVFGVTLINQSNKKTWRFTGEFNSNTAKDIVESICLIKKLNSQVRGDTIFIK